MFILVLQMINVQIEKEKYDRNLHQLSIYHDNIMTYIYLDVM